MLFALIGSSGLRSFTRTPSCITGMIFRPRGFAPTKQSPYLPVLLETKEIARGTGFPERLNLPHEPTMLQRSIRSEA
jgi:hypothetical protein